MIQRYLWLAFNQCLLRTLPLLTHLILRTTLGGVCYDVLSIMRKPRHRKVRPLAHGSTDMRESQDLNRGRPGADCIPPLHYSAPNNCSPELSVEIILTDFHWSFSSFLRLTLGLSNSEVAQFQGPAVTWGLLYMCHWLYVGKLCVSVSAGNCKPFFLNPPHVIETLHLKPAEA